MAEKQQQQRQEEEEDVEVVEVQMRRCVLAKDEDQTLWSQPWYWPHISRGEADRRLARQPDGTFLVRDCTVPGDYTLSVRMDGCNKCVRIYRQEKGFSLSWAESSALFNTLSDLVNYYRANSLATFNKRLGVHLQKAVRKPAADPDNQYSVFKELYNLSQKMQTAQNQLSLLQKQHSEVYSKVKMLKRTIPALEVVQQIYFDTMALQADWEAMLCREATPPVERKVSVRWLHRERSTIVRRRGQRSTPVQEDCGKEEKRKDLDQHGMTADEGKSWTDNTALVLSRHKAVRSRLAELEAEVQVSSSRLQTLESDVQYVELSLVNMKNKHDELVRQLVHLGCQKEFVCKVLESPVEMPEFDRSTWLIDCTREEAVARLEMLPHGAFIVRHKAYVHFPYIMSVVFCKDDSRPPSVHHCFILRPKGRGFGFKSDLAVFQSIEELVLRHRYVSLGHYFSGLDVMLSLPAGCQEMLQRSSELDRPGMGNETCC